MRNIIRMMFGSVRRTQVTFAIILIGAIAVIVDPTIPHVVTYRLLKAMQPAIQLGINTTCNLAMAVAPLAIMIWFLSRVFKGGGKKK